MFGRWDWPLRSKKDLVGVFLPRRALPSVVHGLQSSFEDIGPIRESNRCDMSGRLITVVVGNGH